MKKALPILFGLLLIALCTLAISSYRTARQGTILYAEFFTPTPPGGYAAERTLTAGQVTTDTDASILRQGITYHQEERYDYALASLRAYLESNPDPVNPNVELLAATAAMASGEYAEAESYLQDMPRETAKAEGAYLYYGALINLREEQLEAAENKLITLGKLPGAEMYPAAEILEKMK